MRGGRGGRLLRRTSGRVADTDQVGGVCPVDGVDGIVDRGMKHREAARRMDRRRLRPWRADDR